jgi:aspartyl-tRNA(Asn)/glutamyl-tRNA(Gln) amidotransferase subunit A
MSGTLSRRAFVRGAAATGLGAGIAGNAAARPRRAKATGLPDAAAVAARGAHPADLTVVESAALLQARLISSAELVAACQERIATRNGAVSMDGAPDAINAWIRLHPDLAAQGAASADDRLSARAVRRRGRAPLLCGVPLALKDLYAVKGKGLQASSRVLDGNVAPEDSTVWQRLRTQGMVLLGHTHTHEFAAGTSTPQTGNPWDLTKIIGGSSGGSAAALAARMVGAATGSDTGGSLRYPAALAGVTSIKPTYGRVPTHGVIPLSWSLDHAGPMARSAADLGLLLAAMQGADPADGPSRAFADDPHYALRATAGALRGARIGLPDVPALADMDPGVRAVVERFAAELQAMGATLVPFAAPADDTGVLTLAADVAAYHAQFADRVSRYRPATAALVTAVRALNPSAVDYLNAQRNRARLGAAWAAAFAAHDLDAVAQVVWTNEPAARSGGELNILDSLTANAHISTWDSTGFPVVTTPAGRSAATGVPVGVQLIGTPRTEAKLLRLALGHQAEHPYVAEAPSF